MNPNLRIRIEGFGLAVLCVATLSAFAFGAEDSGILFNYVNNVHSPLPLYFYGDYVPLIPELTAYASHFLPFPAQPILYRLVALVVLLVLYRELKLLLRLFCSDIESILLSGACIFCLCFVEQSLLATLSYTIWSAVLAAIIYTTRLALTGARFSAGGAVGVLAGGLSNPAGVLILPVFAAIGLKQTSCRERLIPFLGACGFVAYGVWCRAAATEQLRIDFYQRWVDVNQSFLGDYRYYNILTAICVLALAANFLVSLVQRERRRLELDLWVTYIGLASAGLYFFSPRFADYKGFPARYIVILVTMAFIVTALSAIRFATNELRLLVLGTIFGFCFALLVSGIYVRGRGAFLESVDVVRFLQFASTFRAECRSDMEAIGYVPNRWSSFVLCRPREFPLGYNSIVQTEFWTRKFGSGDNDELPRLYVGNLRRDQRR